MNIEYTEYLDLYFLFFYFLSIPNLRVLTLLGIQNNKKKTNVESVFFFSD